MPEQDLPEDRGAVDQGQKESGDGGGEVEGCGEGWDVDIREEETEALENVAGLKEPKGAGGEKFQRYTLWSGGPSVQGDAGLDEVEEGG